MGFNENQQLQATEYFLKHYKSTLDVGRTLSKLSLCSTNI